MLTMTGEEATFTVAGRVVVPGVTATVLTMVVPAGTLSTVGAEDGGIFCVAAAAAVQVTQSQLICHGQFLQHSWVAIPGFQHQIVLHYCSLPAKNMHKTKDPSVVNLYFIMMR